MTFDGGERIARRMARLDHLYRIPGAPCVCGECVDDRHALAAELGPDLDDDGRTVTAWHPCDRCKECAVVAPWPERRPLLDICGRCATVLDAVTASIHDNPFGADA